MTIYELIPTPCFHLMPNAEDLICHRLAAAPDSDHSATCEPRVISDEEKER